MTDWKTGDKVEMTSDYGDARSGQRGKVVESNTLFGEHAKVRLEDGRVVEVSNDSLKRGGW